MHAKRAETEIFVHYSMQHELTSSFQDFAGW